MKCVNCGKSGIVIDMTDDPVFLEQHLSILCGDKENPENYHDFIIQLHAERKWGLRANRYLQICEECFSRIYMIAIEQMFKQRGIPREIPGGKEER